MRNQPAPLPRPHLGAIVAILLIAAFAGASATTWNPTARAVERQVKCTSVYVPEDTRDAPTGATAADVLRDQGWFGDPLDGEERLWHPACR